ncbi:MAG: lipopolysaccharide biosynthesis protein [Deltaproteobacteria bacterium]|nr:lipopolysaccharide biosynthesis protein [Deltaproteobacteria bacterium]MBW2074711.1 lipopolysaccharide biosynthesis protein [Deltaproteobacteria bacterium]
MVTAVVNLWYRWGLKAGLSTADQGLFSGANFAFNILLARWLTPAEYGAFAVAFSIFLFMSGFYNALLLEPMSVLGPANHRYHLKQYLGCLIWIHGGITLGLAVLLLIGTRLFSLFAAQSPIISALFGLGIALPFILFLWFFRRAFYIEHDPMGALSGSLLYGSLLIIGLIILKTLHMISLITAFLLMGLVSMIASGILFFRLKPNFINSYVMVNAGLKVVFRENWHYGRWVVGTTFVYWLSGNVYYIFIAGFLGFEETGALRALQNFVLPLTQVMTALGLLLLPWVSGRFANEGLDSLKRDVPKITTLITGLAVAYFFGVSILGEPLIRLLYDGKYSAFIWLLPYLAAAPLISALGSGCQLGLKAVQAPWAIFIAYCVSAAVTVSLGAVFVHLWGLKGAAIGGLFSLGSQFPVIVWYWKRMANKKTDEIPI